MSDATNTPQTPAAKVRILVLGDVNLDTLLVPLPGEMNWWRIRRRGGAWLLAEIIDAALKGINEPVSAEAKKLIRGKSIEVETYDQTRNGVRDDQIKSALDRVYLNSGAILGLFPKRAKGGLGSQEKVYRVERLLGWVHNEKEPIISGEKGVYSNSLEKCMEPYHQNGADGRDILVFHDKAGDFRALHPGILTRAIEEHYKKDQTWIVWQMYSPVADKHLWDVVAGKEDWLKRTIVVVKVDCLRQAGVNLPDDISLEKECEMFEDCILNAKGNPKLAQLTRAGHMVVDCHRQGVLHYAKEKGCLESSCYYCPFVSAPPATRKFGSMVGYTSILVASIVRGIGWSLLCGRSDPSKGITDGIKQGVVLDHLHFLHGYADGDGESNILKPGVQPAPYSRLFEKLAALANVSGWREGSSDYRVAAIPVQSQKDRRGLSRITGFIRRRFKDSDAAGERDEDKRREAIRDHAVKVMRDIVCRGLEKVVDEGGEPKEPEDTPDTPPHAFRCPFEVHGKLKTAYRNEIDNFASIRRMIVKYLNHEHWEAPLSIAVFGQPGTGKSFTIRQILESVNPDIVKRPLEFNLAQFVNTKDLEIAFHKVQDEAVAGGVPLVFFDEFDAGKGDDELVWLKHFLAPMQDGKFKAGESTYRVGRAIFVFAGGISKSWHEFYEQRKGDAKFAKFQKAKGTDFVSRLRAYLDIHSINCPKDATEVDEILMFRRAVLLRSLLEQHFKEIFDINTKEARIDDEVIDAFLKVPRYEHETRSMQAIIEMSRLSSRGRFQVSSFPPSDQLQMHVNAARFLSDAR